MKLIYFLFFTLTFSICSADSNYLLIPDERFIPCDGTDIGRNPLDLQGLTIDLDFILLDNNKIMLNGTCTFKTTVEAPWNILINGEKLERGQWTQRIVKNMKDACNDLFNPMDVFYSNMNTFQRCPMEKGVSLKYCETLMLNLDEQRYLFYRTSGWLIS